MVTELRASDRAGEVQWTCVCRRKGRACDEWCWRRSEATDDSDSGWHNKSIYSVRVQANPF